ncbi:MAG: cupin [Bryobacteraceae bacterium]
MGIQRTQFNAMLTAASLAMSMKARTNTQPEVLRLVRNGWMPNNEYLAVLLYRGALSPNGKDAASECEAIFQRNGWPPQWRNGVYAFHHYHSTAHEVLGFVAGSATLMLGGERGHQVEVHAGDIALLPTGTGHCELRASSEFLVVGAYPAGQEWDICRSAPSPQAIERMRNLPFPNSDPLYGPGGPMTKMTLGSTHVLTFPNRANGDPCGTGSALGGVRCQRF